MSAPLSQSRTDATLSVIVRLVIANDSVLSYHSRDVEAS
jgi:hypothetical protein